jgi:septal ring factor EnvC (AmiA/AmiB activator)
MSEQAIVEYAALAAASTPAGREVPGLLIAFLSAIGAVLFTPIIRLLYNRMAAGDKAWEARVAKLESDAEKKDKKIAELEGRLNQLTQDLHQRDVTIATLTLKLEQKNHECEMKDEKIATLEMKVDTLEQQNHGLQTELKMYKPDFK